MYDSYEQLLQSMKNEQESQSAPVSLFSKYAEVDMEDAYLSYAQMLQRMENGFVERSDYEHRQRMLRKRQVHMSNPLNFCTVM